MQSSDFLHMTYEHEQFLPSFGNPLTHYFPDMQDTRQFAP